ncbi:MAG TPA: hypothetical protein DGB32_05140 [Dehalococcoidia bacterium]|nr:hypothetical protein [Dehalococcoidia bacterium]
MATKARMEFGYNPPAGDRGLENIVPRDYLGDLHRSLDVASQGFTSLWVSDHLNYADEWRVECWTLLTWIAARYPGPELGTIVMSNSFRTPSILAKMAASLHEMSSGRFILGYGAGWHEGEHTAYGLEYPSPRQRIEMFEEGVQVIKAMWTDSPASFSGQHYMIENAYSEPRPDPLPPLMLGGGGEQLTLGVVARHADWWNDVSRSIAVHQRKLDALRGHCDAAGRDYDSIRKTLTHRIFIDRDNAKARRRGEDWASGGDQRAIAGDPSAVIEQFEELAEMGFDLCIATFPDFQSLGDMKLFMETVVPALA